MLFGLYNFSKVDLLLFAKIASCFAFIFLLPLVAFAASLSFSPSGGSYTVGSSFTVAISVGSGGQAVNAVSGTVNFPADKLEVISTSKSQSILSLWVQEPSYSNSVGTVNFEGIILNPGYSGNSGRILSVTFRVKNEGQAKINFSTASALANDGQGTEILSSRGSGTYQLTAVETILPGEGDESLESDPTTSEDVEEKASVTLHSSTHPADGWSNKNEGTFEFDLTDDIVAMRLLLDEEPNSIPTVVYSPPLTSRTISDLSDGVSYLHVQYKDANGWGDVLHYKLQIDRTVPESLSIKNIDTGIFALVASDISSGLAYFEVQVDDSDVTNVTAEEPFYKATNLIAGAHTLNVKAYDKAGNFVETSYNFEIPADSDRKNTPENGSLLNDGNYLVSNGAVMITILSIMIPVLALLLMLGYMLFVSWRTFGGFKKRLDKEILEARIMVSKAFTLLKADLEVDIKTLETASKKRKLTRTELKLLKSLRNNIDVAEEVITKEVKDIETESKS